MSGLRERAQPHVRELQPYPPGKPISEVQRELGLSRVVKLASNESPLGPSPAVRAALEGAIGEIHRYPDGSCYHLRQALCTKLALRPEQLVFGAGVDEVLELAVKAFVGPGDEVVFPWPSFAMYPIVTRGLGGTPVSVPLDAELQTPVDALASAVTPRTKLVFVANPNNPSGRSISAGQLRALAQKLPPEVVLACDEAYFEYARSADFPDSLALLRERPGTLVMRTFSKAYGLAGLRVGYGVADPELIDLLERVRHPFNVNALAQVAAQAALSDSGHLERVVELTHRGLAQLEAGLRELGVPHVPSDANFLLIEVGERASAVERGLLARGVITRGMRAFGLDRHLRVTVGTPEENAFLLDALAQELGRS